MSWDKTVPLILLTVIYGCFAWILVLLLNQPKRFFDGLIARPYRWWGIEFTVVDESRFRRVTRLFGLLMLVLVALHATLVYFTILSGK